MNDLSVKKTWEEFVQEWVDLTEESNNILWKKVDILLQVAESFGEKSIAEFAKQVHGDRHTFTNYFRTAKAFPPETRVPDLSFEVHLRASGADEYKNGEFIGNQRFYVLKEAADKGLSTAKVKAIVRQEKEKRELQISTLPCWWCKSSEPEVLEYMFYSVFTFKLAERYNLHTDCFEEMVDVLENAKHAKFNKSNSVENDS